MTRNCFIRMLSIYNYVLSWLPSPRRRIVMRIKATVSSAALSEATSGVRATKIFLSSHFRTSIWSVPTDMVAITFRFEPAIKTIYIRDTS